MVDQFETITREEELKTASFDERLAAARHCQDWGYRVGFHFDPLIHYEGWETDYKSAVEEMSASSMRPGSVVSLGSLRFTPHLKEIVRLRFPKSRIPYGEFVPGHHRKTRYFRFSIREEMYAGMRSWIRQAAPESSFTFAWKTAPPGSTAALCRRILLRCPIKWIHWSSLTLEAGRKVPLVAILTY